MAIQTITYSNKTALNSNSGVADTNKVNAADMNEIKTVVNNNAGLLYPVGSLLCTTSSTNPGGTLGGTWTEVPCHELIDSGTITTSSGITLGQCEYRLYANGDLEVFGYSQPHTVTGRTSTVSTVTMPYTTLWGAINVNIAYGGADWATVGLYGYTNGNQLNFSEWQNVATDTANFQFAFRAICKIDLAANNVSTLHCYKRTA